MKKVVGFSLALVILLTMTATVWADDPTGDLAVIQAGGRRLSQFRQRPGDQRRRPV